MRFQIRVSGAWRGVLAVLGMRPSSCFVDLDPERGTIHVKGGIWFDETLPIAEIAAVSPSTWPWYGGLGVKLGPGDAVSVVGSTEGVVAIRFRSPQPMRAVFSVRRPELRVSLEDPEGFMAAVRAAEPLVSRSADPSRSAAGGSPG